MDKQDHQTQASRQTKIAVDALTGGSGGLLNHLVNLLTIGESESHSKEVEFIVYGNDSLANLLANEGVVPKNFVNVSWFSRSYFRMILWYLWVMPWKTRKADGILSVTGLYIWSWVPSLVMFRNMLPLAKNLWKDRNWSSERLRLELLRIVYWISFRQADVVLCLTEDARQETKRFTQLPELKSVVIPHGLSAEILEEGKRRLAKKRSYSQINIIYVSSFEWYKNHEAVIEAVAILRSHGIDVGLNLVGGKESKRLEELRIQSIKVGVGNYVNIQTFLKHNDLMREVRNSDIVVFASSCENLPNALLEAIGSGIPVCASRREPMASILGDCGYLFDETSPSSIAQAIQDCISDIQNDEKLQNAYSRALSYNWHDSIGRTITILKEMVSSRNTPIWKQDVQRLSMRELVRNHNRLSQSRLSDRDYIVQVKSWLHVKNIENQFVTYSLNPNTVVAYIRKIGLRSVARKIYSRLTEMERNKKIIGLGIGRVIRAPDGAKYAIGKLVVFLATNHSKRWTYLSINESFIGENTQLSDGTEGFYCELNAMDIEIVERFEGHSVMSGYRVDEKSLSEFFENITLRPLNNFESPKGSGEAYKTLTYGKKSHLTQHRTAKVTVPSAVLFGLGNYAKTEIIPSIKGYVDLQRIHEIDPDQIATTRGLRDIEHTTSPIPIDARHFDLWFIAGYHHTHTPLCINAMEKGSGAIVEKPIATTLQQLDDLKKAVRLYPNSPLFFGFHKRYHNYSQKIKDHLRNSGAESFDMHCIVFEIPLPARHWYNWPVSRGRLISNGCHWIDYFCFMNEEAPVESMNAHLMDDRTVHATIKLANGALFTMVITDKGSPRTGVREYIELRGSTTTATIQDGKFYSIESDRGVIDRGNEHPWKAYRRMYRDFVKTFQNNTHCHTPNFSSTEISLILESMVDEQRMIQN